MTKRRSTGPASEGTGPWKGVRDIKDPYAVPPDYLRDASNVYIPDGKGGSGAYARPGFRRVIVLPGSQVSDAIVRGTLVWVDSMSAGKAQSIGGGLSDRIYGRYVEIVGTFDFADTGGPDGGGRVTATAATSSLAARELTTEAIDGQPALGPPARLGAIISDAAHRHGSLFAWHNLNGIPIASPVKILDLGHMRVMVNPDRTLTVQWHEIPNGSTDIWHTIETSTLTVPVAGWFLHEYQWGISPLNYNKGGFFKARRYIPAVTPVIGESILSTVGTRTRGEFSTTLEFSFPGVVCVPQNTSVGGIGILVPTGAAPRWVYEAYLGAALPSADGDTVQSDIHYEHHDTYEFDANGDPQVVGMDLVWGDANRWKNVRSLTRSASSADEQLETTANIGSIAASTSRWFIGPTYPTDAIVRNSLRDAAMDLMRVEFLKAHAEIIALGPFALAGWRVMVAVTGGFGGGFNLPWVFTGPNPHVPNIGATAGGDVNLATVLPGNLAYELVMKLATGELVTNRGSIGNSEWRTLPGFQSSLPGVTEGTWLATALPQPGIRGDFRVLDAIGGLNPANRWMETDVAQVGLDIVYRKRAAPVTVFEAQPPIADFSVVVNGISHGAITIQDASVDFNGDENATVTGVVSRVMNWGDGTAPETIGTGPSHQASHQYLLHGTYVASLAATNANALSNAKALTFVVPIGTALAQFTPTSDTGDLSGLTTDFADASSVQNGLLALWAWTFGDGHTSTLQNPTHTYAAPATYTVTLTVTGDSGQTDDFTAPVTVPPVVVSGGCGLTAVAKTVPATVGVQADDYAGGNARFISYLTSTNLRNYVSAGTPYRALYQFSYANASTDYELDTVATFNGRSSLKVSLHANGYGAFGSEFSNDTTNLGDDSDFSNDRVNSLWVRIIFKLDPHLISNANAVGATNGDGLQIAALYGRNNYNPVVYGAGGHVYQDIFTRLTTGASETRRELVDLGVIAAIGAQNWCELIAYAGSDEVANTQRNMVWIGAACSLTGTSPLCDRTNVAHLSFVGDTNGLTFENVDWIDYFDTASGGGAYADPKPFANISLVEIHRVSRATNPFGVSLT